MTATTAIDTALRAAGNEDADMASGSLRNAALHALNAALQEMRTGGLDIWAKKDLVITTSAGVGTYALPQNVQRVEGPVLSTTGELTEVRNLGTFHNLALRMLGKATMANARPQWYHARTREGTAGGNPTKIELLFKAVPDGVYVFDVTCVMEATALTWDDYCDATPLLIPHDYGESVLLPLMREKMASDNYFTHYELTDSIRGAAKSARETLAGVSLK